jgi:Arylsulfotransferase (ASST)
MKIFSMIQRRKNKLSTEIRWMVFFIIFLLLSTYISSSFTQKINQTPLSLHFSEGQFLYSPMWTTSTYLRYPDGTLNHSWASSYFPGIAVWWLGDGTILRTIRTGSGGGTGGSGGGVQKVAWDGTITWDFRYNTGGVLTHHDVKTLPNGNILMIAWETKTFTEAIAAGRNPSYVTSLGLWPDHLIEVQPTGPTSGEIVWEWHVWDHLIQDYDSTKANYGVVGNHPELVDINYVSSTKQDWLHTNSIDYNAEFDQILVSVLNFNEIWIIDHSTTTEEAAGHSGGNSGKGGDLLYRWGNPMTYDAGTVNDRKLFMQHDASWIDEGCPGAGDILIFNNGANRPGSHYSTVDEITPPVDESGEYFLQPGTAYGPETQTWMYIANPPTSFYASHISGAWRLSSGNTLITNGESGKIFEVTPEGSTVWQYSTGGQLFKVVYVPSGGSTPPHNGTTPNLDCSGSLFWSDIKPGATVTGNFQIQNIGGNESLLNWTVDASLISWGTWTFNPESGNGLTPENGPITIQATVVAPDEIDSDFEGFIKVKNSNDPADYGIITVTLSTPVKIIPPWAIILQQFLRDLLQNHPLLQTFMQHLI